MDNKISTNYVFDVRSKYGYEENFFMHELIKLKREAQNSNVDFSYTIKEKEIQGEKWFQITVTPYLLDIKAAGYKFIGVIVPCECYDEDKKKYQKDTRIFLSEKYQSNQNVIDDLKKVASKESCDNCHNKNEHQEIFYCFLEGLTGRIKVFCKECTEKFFEIKINKNNQYIFEQLKYIAPWRITDCYFNKNGDVVSEIFIEHILNDDVFVKYNYGIINGCITIKENGPLCNIKLQSDTGDEFVKRSMYDFYSSIDSDGYFNEEKYNFLLGKDEEDGFCGHYLFEQSRHLIYDFYVNGLSFFNTFIPRSDFEEMCRCVGLYVLGGKFPKERLSNINIASMIPYVVGTYFGYKSKNKYKQIKPFDGVVEMVVKIHSNVVMHGNNRKQYKRIFAVTENNEMCSWPDFIKNVCYMAIGEKYRIKATYNRKYGTLDILEMEPIDW